MAVDAKQQPSAQNGTGRPETASPTATIPTPVAQAPSAEASKSGDVTSDVSGSMPATPAAAEAGRPVKYRHEWLQTPTHVEVRVQLYLVSVDVT